jgi:GNAT superfamily N-acetyltransferase
MPGEQAGEKPPQLITDSNIFDPDKARWIQSLSGGAYVLIRPIRRLDFVAEHRFTEALPSDARRHRFLGHMARPSENLAEHLDVIDPLKSIVLVAIVKEGASEAIVGVARYSNDLVQSRCDCALIVADDWQHRGLGTALLKHLIELARAAGIENLAMLESGENTEMRDLVRHLGFHVNIDPNDSSQVIFSLNLQPS